ncbi:hypothetical protein EVAR_63407_1 [Eumeta japonica]|uniref:Uncharacterized protein n=1 Tax=Eumeta variegata TaxID=151549 RepID=A0A4C1Z1K1_EUMVA|nr:hypothetical protein EVAR_63407_1 [Eumeta japonica]
MVPLNLKWHKKQRKKNTMNRLVGGTECSPAIRSQEAKTRWATPGRAVDERPRPPALRNRRWPNARHITRLGWRG